MKGKKCLSVLMAFLALLLFNLVGNVVSGRFDLTEDHRYTLSSQALQTVAGFEGTVTVDILLDGDLPAEFLKLKEETGRLLEQFRSRNKAIHFNFVNPLEDVSQQQATMAQLQSLGLTPANITVEDQGKVSQEILFPWAMVNYRNNTIKVPLLKNKLGSTTEERITNSVQNLEYAFADAFTKLKSEQKKRVAVIKGNGELPDLEMADFLTSIRDYYNIAAITLDSVAVNPQKVLDQLQTFDLALIAKPTETFSEPEKYVIDQFIVHGGKSIWLLDKVAIELDSLMNEQGSSLALPRPLNLDDFFFPFGIRINAGLVNDMYFTQIVLASGEGNNSSYNPIPWYYHPMVFSRNDHPINTNTEALRLQFANSLDTLRNDYKKTILYYSSPLSRVDTAPKLINLEMAELMPDKESFTQGNYPLAVLVEGKFKSAYDKRVKPLQLRRSQTNGPMNAMLLVADGDVIRNQLRNGRPLELGYDKWTNNFYGNKEFLINSVNYLLDDSGIINIRNKKVEIPLLDQQKIRDGKIKWQLLTTIVPLLFCILIALGYAFVRNRRYAG